MPGQQTRGSRTAGKALGDGRELASDRRARRAAAGERDAPLEAAYNAGRRGDDPAEYQTSDELFGYYQDGARAAKAEQRSARVGELRSGVGAKAGTVANDGAGFLLGLLAYALMANYLRGGTPAVRAWLAAKFLNRAGTTGTAVAATPSRPAQPVAAQFRVGGA